MIPGLILKALVDYKKNIDFVLSLLNLNSEGFKIRDKKQLKFNLGEDDTIRKDKELYVADFQIVSEGKKSMQRIIPTSSGLASKKIFYLLCFPGGPCERSLFNFLAPPTCQPCDRKRKNLYFLRNYYRSFTGVFEDWEKEKNELIISILLMIPLLNIDL